MTETGGPSQPMTMLRDTREKQPWTFESCPVETRDVTLSTGDYALAGHCRRDPALDTYSPQFAVERKSGPDFLSSLTWDRDRFERELRRAANWPQPLAVVVETSWSTLLGNRGCMARREVHPNQIAGTVRSWADQYNVAFHFTDTRQQAERCALLVLARYRLVRRRDG